MRHPSRSRLSAAHARIVAGFALMSLTAAVLAGPPLITDDPDTLPKGRFELNTAYTLTLSGRDAAGGGRTWEQEAPIFDLNYGLTEGVQLKFELPFVVLDPRDDESVRAGLGDLSLGTKLRFLTEKEAPLSVSIYPALGVPVGSRGRGLGTGSPSFTMPVQVGRRFLEDKLFVYADGGYEEEFAEGEADRWFTGIAAEYEIREGLTLCGELRHDFGVRGSSDDSLFNVGFKCTLSESATLIGSAGRSFNPSSDSGSALLGYFGVQWSF
jgi:hypothetical protein